MKTILTLFACLFLTASCLFAQHAHFTTSGTIEYEKSVNAYAVIKKMLGNNIQGLSLTVFEQYQKTQPQFSVLKSTLTFSGNKTLFTPLPAPDIAQTAFGNIPMIDQNNTIYTDLSANTVTAQRKFVGDNFLVKDSVRKINWRIMDETREVAGYTCRRANALVLDSIYVVAFFTTGIHVPGGPESFAGLPGMILELAIPHENIIWRAVKVTDTPIPEGVITPPKKGKPLTGKKYFDLVTSTYKDRNTYTYPRVILMIKDYLL